MASCENKYTTLLDLSRQAKIITGETACFNGKIEAGIPFSGYPTGVDTGSTVSLGVVSSETAVFSGNTGTTIFDVSNTGSTNYDAIFSGYSGTVWTNALFSGNTSGLTLPITPLSANTQIVGPFWTLTQTGMTGDYVIGTQYTGYSITYSFSQTQQLGFVTGFTAYSGLTSASQENFSAGTLDYKGPLDYISSVEDATIDGRLTTDRLTVTDGASASTIGYVLTQLDGTGKAGWVYNSSTASTNTFVTGGTLNGTNLDLTWNTGGSVPSIELSGLTFTGNTSGDCISNLYLTNLYGCSPLHIEPSGVNDVYIVENGGNVGIGTNTPAKKLHVNGDVIISGDPGILEIYDTTNLKTQIGQNGFGFLQFNRTSVSDEDAFIANYAPSGNTVFRCGDNGSDTDDVMVLYGSGNTVSNTELIFSGDSEPLIFGNGNLEVFGNIGIKQLETTAGGTLGILPSGKLTSNDSSDIRLKENISPLSNSLSTILNLSGVTFNWKDRESGGNEIALGFIAQDVQKVDSRLISVTNNNDYLGVRDRYITPLIVESIKEIHNNPSIPNYTPTSSNDSYGNIGNVTSDDDYLYVKTNNGWKRTSLESF